MASMRHLGKWRHYNLAEVYFWLFFFVCLFMYWLWSSGNTFGFFHKSTAKLSLVFRRWALWHILPLNKTLRTTYLACNANRKLGQSYKLERQQSRAVNPYKTQAHVELLKTCRVAAWNGKWATCTTWECCQMLTKVLLHCSKKSLKPICSEMLQEALELNNLANLS